MQSNMKSWITMNVRSKMIWQGLEWKSMFAVTLWTIWKDRNTAIFSNEVRSSNNVIWSIMHQARSIQTNNITLAKAKIGRVEHLINWTFPEDGWVKCNSDGACVEGGNRTACGGVLRDCSGSWVKGYMKYLGSSSVLAAELWGIYCGLETT